MKHDQRRELTGEEKKQRRLAPALTPVPITVDSVLEQISTLPAATVIREGIQIVISPPIEFCKGDGMKGSLDNVTIMIKAFERPKCLERLLKSIDKFYPGIKIIVADDSRVPSKNTRPNVTFLKLPYNSGISYGKNRAMAAATTPYVVSLDDDFIFTAHTQLEIWLNILENSNIDLVGGNVTGFANYFGCLNETELARGIAHFERRDKGIEFGCPVVDIVLSFWMGKKEAIQAFGGYDDDFKVVEHSVFFLRAFKKIKVAHCDRVTVDHFHPCGGGGYDKLDGKNEFYEKVKAERANEYAQLLLTKHNLVKYIGPLGNTVVKGVKT
jgi:(N-acetylneuraminyl)-galactosylglucosylceramide N-acetylgalactosaminyltransferase